MGRCSPYSRAFYVLMDECADVLIGSPIIDYVNKQNEAQCRDGGKMKGIKELVELLTSRGTNNLSSNF